MTPVRPSEVTTWLRCPRLWQYQYVEGWKPAPGSWSPEMLMGTAVHAGLAAGWKWGEVPRRAVEAAFAGGWPEDAPAEHDRNALEAQALRVLGAVTEWCAREMPDAEPLMVEEALGTDGHTTPDLVTREGGQLVITDWKYSHHVPADRIHYRLEGPDRPCIVVIIGGPKIVVKDATFRP